MTTTPQQFSEGVAAEVRAELARQHKTHADVGAALGKSLPTVLIRVRGEKAWDIYELAVLAHWLEVPVERFMPVSLKATA